MLTRFLMRILNPMRYTGSDRCSNHYFLKIFQTPIQENCNIFLYDNTLRVPNLLVLSMN